MSWSPRGLLQWVRPECVAGVVEFNQQICRVEEVSMVATVNVSELPRETLEKLGLQGTVKKIKQKRRSHARNHHGEMIRSILEAHPETTAAGLRALYPGIPRGTISSQLYAFRHRPKPVGPGPGVADVESFYGNCDEPAPLDIRGQLDKLIEQVQQEAYERGFHEGEQAQARKVKAVIDRMCEVVKDG